MSAQVITVGCDPEAFLSSKGMYIPAVGLVGGTKEAPIFIDGGMIQEDNVMAEFGITPATTAEEFSTNISRVVAQLEAKVAPLSLEFVPSVRFAPKQLDTDQAKIFGCEPDFNAWTVEMNNPPNPELVGNLRTAGGHVHVGFGMNEEDPMERVRVARMMDILLGIPSVLMDGDNERRSVYGSAGAHRPKDYGLEYRTLSNFWLKNDNLRQWVFHRAVEAVQTVNLLDDYVEIAGGPDNIQRIINTGDRASAEKVVEEAQLTIPA